MKDANDPTPTSPTTPPPIPTNPPPRPISYWVKRLLVCNPFYLVSAALLLYGVYRVTLDTNGFLTELRQFTFSFTALHSYELVLVATVALLAARRIWYDGSLLIALESMLWLVPFILVHQGALINPRIAMVTSAVTGTLVVLRAAWLLKRAPTIVPPRRVFLIGLPLLLVNAAWPIIFRHIQETRFGVNMTEGAAYYWSETNWFALLPLLAALTIFLPDPDSGFAPSNMRRWFPTLLFSLWLAGTGVHLYALGYVYDFALRREQVAPVLLVLAWVAQFRLTDFFALPPRGLQTFVTTLPLLATMPAALVVNSRVFFYLSMINLVVYGCKLLSDSNPRLVKQLALASLAFVVSSLPIDFNALTGRIMHPGDLIALALFAYVLVGAMMSRNPKVAILGAFAAVVLTGMARQRHLDAFHWAFQAGFAYFLMHSWRWNDSQHVGAKGARWFIAALWVLHSFCWTHGTQVWIGPIVVGASVATLYILRGLLFKSWQPVAIAIAAGLTALCPPLDYAATKISGAPAGVLYVVASFLLFGVGTLAALTKHRWHKATPQ